MNNAEGVLHSGKNSKHGMRADHLLNFSYSPLPSQESGLGVRPNWRGRRSKQLVITKEQFLQANCQFVMKQSASDSSEYLEHLTDPDKMVDWSTIEQVVNHVIFSLYICRYFVRFDFMESIVYSLQRLNSDQLAVCPICLDIPVAARITKCAHVYCWSCILHYLSLSDRSWAKCPICFDAIAESDLKR